MSRYAHLDIGPDQSKAVETTLDRAPRLAAHVRSICFDSAAPWRHDGELNARIVTLCPRLSSIRFNSWIANGRQAFISALRQANELRHLEIVQLSANVRSQPIFTTYATTLDLVQGWPRLATLSITGCVGPADCAGPAKEQREALRALCEGRGIALQDEEERLVICWCCVGGTHSSSITV